VILDVTNPKSKAPPMFNISKVLDAGGALQIFLLPTSWSAPPSDEKIRMRHTGGALDSHNDQRQPYV